MANSSVLSRKDMREPDRFQVVANQAAAWVAARKKQVALVGGAAALAIVGLAVVATVQSSRSEAAGNATSALLELVGAPVVATPSEGSTARTFPTEEAKERAVIAEADKVAAEHGGTRAGALAILVKGEALYALHEWDPAAAELERFLQAAPKDDSLRFGALGGLGLVAEAKGDLAGAAKAYERMAQDAPAFADRADLERARVLAAAGKKDEARQLLGAFAASHKDSPLAGQAAQRLADLGAK
jgi:tetratricopeptide (TPR) repeat protein